jgi:uncharacterized membrane protein YkoI
MNAKTLSTLALAGLLAAATLARPALAAGSDEDREATALQGARVTLSQAIATAEQRTGGRAYDAGVDLKGGQPRIAVETNGPKGVQTVIVDAQTGQVVGAHVGAEQD